MPDLLHVTNGSAAVDLMREAGLPGEFLSWDDALHDGPAPAGLSLREFSEVRARFVAECGWAHPAQARRRFRWRDEKLESFPQFKELVLWFERDLYDQLQLIQILDWLAQQRRLAVRLALVQSWEHLGRLSPASFPSLFQERSEASEKQLKHARQAWSAFTSADPTSLLGLPSGKQAELPFLDAALRRFLEEFPGARDGLSRSERQILGALSQGPRAGLEIFRECQAAEESPFMGDWSFWRQVARLAQGKEPLLIPSRPPLQPLFFDSRLEEFRSQVFQLSRSGLAALEGRADQIALNGCDRWLGGVRLETGRHWRWDRQAGRLLEIRLPG